MLRWAYLIVPVTARWLTWCFGTNSFYWISLHAFLQFEDLLPFHFLQSFPFYFQQFEGSFLPFLLPAIWIVLDFFIVLCVVGLPYVFNANPKHRWMRSRHACHQLTPRTCLLHQNWSSSLWSEVTNILQHQLVSRVECNTNAFLERTFVPGTKYLLSRIAPQNNNQ